MALQEKKVGVRKERWRFFCTSHSLSFMGLCCCSNHGQRHIWIQCSPVSDERTDLTGRSASLDDHERRLAEEIVERVHNHAVLQQATLPQIAYVYGSDCSLATALRIVDPLRAGLSQIRVPILAIRWTASDETLMAMQ